MMGDSLVYEGPLAERATSIKGLRGFTYLSLDIEGGPIGPFAERLMRQPIAVRAPGQKYIVWALVGVEEQGRHAVRLATFNLAWPRGFAPFTGDLGLAVAWVWSVLDHYGIAYDAVATHGIDREALVAHYRAGASAAIEWGRIADRLGELGCTLPDDLREQPRLIEGTPVDGDGVPVGDLLACDRLAMASGGDDDGLHDEWAGRRWVGELRGPGAAPGGLLEVGGGWVLEGVEQWTVEEVDAARVVLSGGVLDGAAVVDGERMTVDGAVDRLVARLAALGAGGVRVRLTGLDAATLDVAQDAAALLTETVFYIDGEPGAVDGCLLYDLYEELIFPEG